MILRSFSIVFALMAVLLFAVMVLLSPNLIAKEVERAVEKNRQIERVLLKGASFVENYKVDNGVLPTQMDYEEWASQQPPIGRYSIANTFIAIDDIEYRLNDPNIHETGFGDPLEDSFLIGTWRGEWFEYYVSWTQTTTLLTHADEFLSVKRVTRRFILFLALSFTSGFASVSLWRRSNPTLRSSH